MPNRPKALRGAAINMPGTGMRPRPEFGSPQKMSYGYTDRQRNWDIAGTLVGVGRPNAQAIQTRQQIESHERSMFDKQRASDKDIVYPRLAAIIASMSNKNSLYFGDSTRINNLTSKEAERYFGGSLKVKEIKEKTKGGERLFEFSSYSNNELMSKFVATTPNFIERIHAYMKPEEQTDMYNRRKEATQQYEDTAAFLASSPPIQQIVARNPELMNDVQKAIWNGASMGKTQEEIITKILKATEAEEAELTKERTRKAEKHDADMAEAARKLEAGESLTAAQMAAYSQKQSENMEKFDGDYDFQYPLSEKIQKDPEKLTAYNADKLASRNTELNRRDAENLPEELAQKRSKKRAVKILIDDATGQMVYENANGEQFTDKGCTKPYEETAKKPARAKEKLTKKKKVSSKKRGYDYSKGFTPQVKQAKKAITKTARGALDFINRPMTEEKRRKLPRYSRQGLGQ